MDIFKNAQKAWLLLEDGTLYEGYGLGSAEDAIGELVFNTSVVGFQEILTDPANANNIVVETFPLTGNYGVNHENDLHESITARGWVVREWCPQPSNFRCEGRIDEFLEKKNISAIFDLDTRAITRKIRDGGVQKALITRQDPRTQMDAALAKIKAWKPGCPAWVGYQDKVTFDKLDKIGADGVKKELLEKEFDAAAVEALDEFLRAGDFSLDAVTARVGDETLTADLRYVIATAEKIANGRYGIAYAPSLVRGQGYYTGMVFEVTCPQFSGAVAGGGRYDNMVGKFIGQQVPAVGFSIGFERVCGILLEQDYQIPGAKQKLALLYLKDADFAAVLAKADALRAAYDVTVLPQAKKLGKQFGTLEAAGYNAVAFADNDDIKALGQKAE